MSVWKLTSLLPPNVTVHGFRSSFRDFSAEQTSYPREIFEEALTHTIASVERAYRRSDLLERRRELMELWSQFCSDETAAGNVVQIGRRV